MTITNVYIGELCLGPDPLGHVRAGGSEPIPPPRLGAFFAPSRNSPFYALLGKIRGGQLAGRQIDWGAFAAVVSKNDIFDFIEETYRGDRTYIDPAHLPHLFPKLGELERFVEALPEARYALVAIEL